MRRYLIIGAGAAGIAAAESIRTIDRGGKITVLSAEKDGYYSRPALAYLLSKEIDKKSLYPFTAFDFKRLRIDLIYDKAILIDPSAKEVTLGSGEKLPYDRLLLSTGAKAVKTTVNGKELEGVFYLDSLKQTKELIKNARRGKKAVVIGGGITALEIVEGLHARKMEVHFFLRGNKYWSRVLDATESNIILNKLEDQGVFIHRNTELKEILEHKGKINQILTKSGKLISVNLIGVAIGVAPRTSLAKTAGIEIHRGIRTNKYLETNQEDIFAAGDAAEIFDQEMDRWIVDSLWPIARHQGLIAGMNMAGKREIYQRQIPLNVTRLAGLTTTIIGSVGNSKQDDDYEIVRGESQAWQIMPNAVVCQNNFEVNRLRLMIGEKYLMGAVLMGDQSLSQILEDIIINRVPLLPIRNELLRPDANLSDILIQFNKGRLHEIEN